MLEVQCEELNTPRRQRRPEALRVARGAGQSPPGSSSTSTCDQSCTSAAQPGEVRIRIAKAGGKRDIYTAGCPTGESCKDRSLRARLSPVSPSPLLHASGSGKALLRDRRVCSPGRDHPGPPLPRR